MRVASPECTPAASTCSDTAAATTTPPLATPSNSISSAPSINLVITTGCSGDTSTALARIISSAASTYATFMAAPDSTYDGRTSTGYPTRAANSFASSTEVSARHGGCATPTESMSAENLPRSSAASIDSGEVPRMRTPAACSGMHRLLGICPPTETITPAADSRS